MISPRLHEEIVQTVLAAVYGLHDAEPPALEPPGPSTLREQWWHAVIQLAVTPPDDVDLAWARLVVLSEALWKMPALPHGRSAAP
jgi:hypothetical protein